MLPPEGLVRKATNFRLRRDSEFEQRPGFTALDMTLYGTDSAQVHDLIAHDGRLFGIGNLSGDALDSMTQLFEYVGQASGLAAGWRRVNRGVQLPFVVDVRELGGVPELQGGVDSATCAVNDGIVVFAMANSVTDSLVHVFRASDNATLFLQTLTSTTTRPIALFTVGGKFHIVGIGTTTLVARTYTPATDESFSAASTVLTVDTTTFAAAAVLGAPGGYVIVGTLGANIVVRHYNDSHVQQMTVTVLGIDPTYLAIAANGPQNRITVAYVDDVDDLVKSVVLNLTTGATVSSATHFSPLTTSGQVSVRYISTSSTSVLLAADISSATPRSMYYVYIGLEFFIAGAQLSAEVADLDPTGATGVPGLGFVTGVDGQGVTGLIQPTGVLPLMFKDFGTGDFSPTRLGSHEKDAVTGLRYLVTFSGTDTSTRHAVVTEYRADGIRRRQAASLGGQLYISGGLPVVSDGVSVCEISWGEAPAISSLAVTNTAPGAVGESSRYFIQAHAEYTDARGDVHLGPVSLVSEISTGIGDDTITGVITTGHSLRRAPGSNNGTYRMIIHRTAALADGSAGENLYREQELSISLSGGYGATVAFTLIMTNDALREVGRTIYTQSQTPVQHQAPPPFGCAWPVRDRLALAKLPRTEQWLQSKLLFPGEAAEFSDTDLVQYQGRAEETLLGVVGLAGNLVGFTKRGIHLWQGDGPDHSGQGEFTYAGCLSREGGLVDADGWRSLIELDDGVFFQRETDQLCWLDKSGNVDWVGQAIRDELVTYPVVVAAAHLRKHHLACFAIQNAAGDAGEILTYDLRRKQWFVDDVGVVDALAEYQGRLAYCTRAGAVHLQDALPGTGSMPTQILDTYDFDFGSGQSWGAFIRVGIVGEYRADTTVALAVTYDSFATTPTTIETLALTAANGYVAGAPISVQKALPTRDCERFALRVTVSGSSGSAGIRLQEITLETETAPGMSRLPARDTH